MFKKLLGSPQVETEFEFPKTIEEFGYKFNENGELRNIETSQYYILRFPLWFRFAKGVVRYLSDYNLLLLDEKFLFNVKPNDWKFNQSHYEALGGE